MIRPPWIPCLLTLCVVSTTRAQEPLDSLRLRLERAEEMIEVLQRQIAEARTGPAVEARSGARVELSGLALVNGFYNDDWASNVDAPMFAIPPIPGVLTAPALGGTARQTRLTLIGEAPGVLGGVAVGEIDMDFYGGQLAGGRVNPLMRIRRTRAELVWPHAWVMAGQEAPPIAELNPSSLATLGIPGFSYAGNLWIWLPQVRAGLQTGGPIRLGVEASILAPRSGDTVGTVSTQPDRAERTKRPWVEGRLLGRWGDADAPGEVSVGGHYGWVANATDSLVVTQAVAASLRWFLTPQVEVRGEAFVGELLSVLGGGGAGQGLSPTGTGVRAKGGWAQLNLHPRFDWEVGGGYGFDDPDDDDVSPITGRTKNVQWEAHAIWRPNPLVLGIEYRRIETSHADPILDLLTVNHLNVAVGFGF